ncbi:MAG: hypothetical protein WBA16_09070 [Nonlabens sp.]
MNFLSTKSLLVFNTQASTSLAVGFVYYDGMEWVSICKKKQQE